MQKLSVAPEGASVEDDEEVEGNPAFVADERDERADRGYFTWLAVSLLKTTWALVELGIMCGIWKGAECIDASPEGVDTVSIDYWVIFGATCILLSLLSSIVIKLFQSLANIGVTAQPIGLLITISSV